MEKNLRVAKEDFTEFKNRKEKLEDDFHTATDNVKFGRDEIGTLKNKINENEEERNMTNKKKVDLEKNISDLKYQGDEASQKFKKKIQKHKQKD